MLTDREKLIISLHYITNTGEIGSHTKRFAITEYVKSYQINYLEVVEEMNKEFSQFHKLLNHIALNHTADFNGNYSLLSNREKYIFYNVGFLFQKLLSTNQIALLKEMLRNILQISDDDILLDEIQDQIKNTVEFLEYIRDL